MWIDKLESGDGGRGGDEDDGVRNGACGEGKRCDEAVVALRRSQLRRWWSSSEGLVSWLR